MKRITRFLSLLAFGISSQTIVAQNVGINETGANPNASAMLDVAANNKGILIPRLNRAQKFLINNPANGLLIYQTDDTVGFWYYEQNKWVPVMRSVTAGKGLSGGFIQGNGSISMQSTGVTPGTYGRINEYPVFTVNDLGQLTFAGVQTINDKDSTNELQSISISNDTLYLSKNGGSAFLSGGWRTSGNDNIDDNTDFFGTTTNQAIRIKANNTWWGELNPKTRNISFGDRAHINNKGSDNIAMGRDALYSNVSGTDNIALGEYSLENLRSGSYNVSLGYQSMFNTNNSMYNVALGFRPLYTQISGYYNVALGYYAGYYQYSASYNTAIGTYSLYYNYNGYMNSGLGYASIMYNRLGIYNTGSGAYALYVNQNGNYNTADGAFALRYINGGDYNTAIGYTAGPTSANFDNTTAVGNGAIPTASDEIVIGNGSVTSIGGYADWSNLSDARFKENVQENVKGLDFVMKLRPVTYTLNVHKIYEHTNPFDSTDWESKYTRESDVQTGFIAQEVEQAARETGFNFSGVDAPKGETDHYSLRYGTFVVPMVKAIQEQQAEIEALKKQNQELQAAVQALLNQANTHQD
ncbi:MAG: tail fiber domain-containing protein [Bacteroidia bacterium]